MAEMQHQILIKLLETQIAIANAITASIKICEGAGPSPPVLQAVQS